MLLFVFGDSRLEQNINTLLYVDIRCVDIEICLLLATSQMTARRDRQVDEDVQLRLGLEEERRAEEDYDEMLRQEAERMCIRDFQPKVCADVISLI